MDWKLPYNTQVEKPEELFLVLWTKLVLAHKKAHMYSSNA